VEKGAFARRIQRKLSGVSDSRAVGGGPLILHTWVLDLQSISPQAGATTALADRNCSSCAAALTVRCAQQAAAIAAAHCTTCHNTSKAHSSRPGGESSSSGSFGLKKLRTRTSTPRSST